MDISQAAGIKREIEALEANLSYFRRFTDVPAVRRYIRLVTAHMMKLRAWLRDTQASIDALPDETQRRVLQCRFDGLTLQQTADEIGYCVRNTGIIYRAAVESIRNAQDAHKGRFC